MSCAGSIILVLVAFAVQPSSAAGGRVSPVQKVIQLIADMEAKVARDQKAASKAFTDSAKFCDEEATTKEYAMKDSKEAIETLTATVEDENAKIAAATARIGDLASQVGATEGELSRAASLREKEHADFLGVEKELVGTVKELTGAHATLKASLGASLAQLTPEAHRALDASVSAMERVVEASFLTLGQRSQVRAFLHTRAEAADDLSFAAATKANGGSGAILETLNEMTEKAEGTLANTRKTEMENAHAHALLKAGIEHELKSLKQELGETTFGKQVSVEALATAERDLSMNRKALAADSDYAHDLKHECLKEAQEWEVIHRESVAELKALGSAKEILAKKFGVLLESRAGHQLKVRTVTALLKGGGADRKSKALRMIQQIGRKFKSTALVSLAYRAAADPFGKVRGMVEDMIAKLMQEAAEEATQKAFCDEEMAKSKTSKEDKEMKLDKLDARIEKAEAAIAGLSEDMATLSKEVADIDVAMTSATAIRKEEKAVFVKTELDLSQSEEACGAALEVLREYYEGGSLAQVKVVARSALAVRGKIGLKSTARGDGSGIIGVLELAESEFSQNLAEARAVEAAAEDGYRKMMEDNTLTKATKQMEVKGKLSEVKSLKATLSESSGDKSSLAQELDAVLEYLEKLKPQCVAKVPSYAEVKAAREAEIQGLKDALHILAA